MTYLLMFMIILGMEATVVVPFPSMEACLDRIDILVDAGAPRADLICKASISDA